MKMLRIVLMGLLLAAALAGCTGQNTAHESQGRGRDSEAAALNREQGGRERSSPTQQQGNRGQGGSGPQSELGRENDRPLGQAGAGRDREQIFDTPEQSGKSVVERGSIDDLSGTLKYDGSEWYLDTGNDTYILHFGNSAFMDSTGIELHEGDPIEVRGFVSTDEVAVVSALHNSRLYTFRSEEGTPEWAGRGRRETSIAKRNSDGAGQPRGQSGQGGRGNQDGRGRGKAVEGADINPTYQS